MTVVDAWLPRAAGAHPNRIAIEAGERTISYRELAERARKTALGLRESGVRPGEKVAMTARADIEFAVELHACLWLGAVAVPIDSRLGAQEQADRAARAEHVLKTPLPVTLASKAVTLADAQPADHPALIVHTSGTTGEGTPVALTHGNLAWAALGSAVALGLDPAERWLCTLPLSHVGGLSILIRSAAYATTVVLHPRFEPDRAAHALADGTVTLVSLVPTTLGRLLDAGLRHPPGLRRALVGGGPLGGATREAALKAGLPVVQSYGLTEACSQVTTAREPGDPTAGPPLPLVRVRVGDDGEIAVAGPTVAPAAPAPDGWLRTGDLGWLDDRGRLTVTGRAADTIITGGENVAPAHIESILLAHPQVAEVAVIGRPDPEWGERLVALVVPAGGSPPDAGVLRAFLTARLAPFQIPKAFEWRNELPRTAAGKLRRSELR